MPAKPACFPVPSCHTGPRCRHAPCFRLELHDPSGEIIGGKVADACAYHLGDAVQALACWAAARHLRPASSGPTPSTSRPGRPAAGKSHCWPASPSPASPWHHEAPTTMRGYRPAD